MSISDKVITASSVARQVNVVDALKFNFTQQGLNYFVSINNTNLFVFDNSADCATWTNRLNNCMNQTMMDLRAYYDSKVSTIIA